MPDTVKSRLVAEAHALGFAQVGITSPHAIRVPGERLSRWLDASFHGTMNWMAERSAWRADPATLWPEARSIVMLAEDYGPDFDPLTQLDRRDHGSISVYARGKDYHDVVKKRLKRLGRWLVDTAGGEIKVFVDTAPVMEKPLAAAAGIGWQGRHTNLVSRDLGSWFFLGAIFTTLELSLDDPHPDRCGSCRACLDICPTAAFPAPGVLDARRCISYLTIEHKGPIPRAYRAAIGNRIYGCDDCLAICPWNKFARLGHAVYEARPATRDTSLADLAALSENGFRERFRGSPIKRIGRNRFVRNVLIAIGNSGDPSLSGAAKALLNDADPLVRGAAVWALRRLLPGTTSGWSRQPDPDPTVEEEWNAEMI